MRTELVLKGRMACAIVCALSSVPESRDQSVEANTAKDDGIVLVSDEDLKPADYLSQRNRLVVLPILYSLSIVDHDDEIVLLALVVNLRLRTVSTRHLDR